MNKDLHEINQNLIFMLTMCPRKIRIIQGLVVEASLMVVDQVEDVSMKEVEAILEAKIKGSNL